ncbi:DsbA family protein [Streptomyces anulatus]
MPWRAVWASTSRSPPCPPQPYTALAFEGYQYAAERDLGTAYNQRMFRAFFQENQDLGQIDVLVALAGEIGLDEAGFRAALADGTCRARHQVALREAAAHRVRSVPTLLVGDIRIEGVPRPAQLRKAILDARAQQAEGVVHGASCGIDGNC